jgi:2-keto-4-pentenoate hydratase/2-oxohepta-3-ene-1,7-dioic acid hydratase in catechol pathway
MTLQPGDLVSTGTPQGVGIAMDPPGLLSAGDVVRIEIDAIGTIENPVIAEPDDTPQIG